MPRILFIALVLGNCLTTMACAGSGTTATSVSLSDQWAAGDSYGRVRLLGALRLPGNPVDGLTPEGLSGLAWDEDEGLLYAVSDFGNLFHLRPRFRGGFLIDAEFVAAYPLRDPKNRSLRPPYADSEGLAIENGDNGVSGDSELVVSFEGRPRIVSYSPSGKWLGEKTLPSLLGDADNYASSNSALEAVTLHREKGLLTAPEKPLRRGRAGFVPIFTGTGRFWSYPLHKAPNSALVAMEALPDDSLLILERAFVSLTRPLVISLRRTRLPADPTEPLAVENVAVFDTGEGWLLDNFEGLSRHRGRKFFLVSDDNGHVLQNTLLVYFELWPPAPENGHFFP